MEESNGTSSGEDGGVLNCLGELDVELFIKFSRSDSIFVVSGQLNWTDTVERG